METFTTPNSSISVCHGTEQGCEDVTMDGTGLVAASEGLGVAAVSVEAGADDSGAKAMAVGTAMIEGMVVPLPAMNNVVQ
jgi:hypothetical protein